MSSINHRICTLAQRQLSGANTTHQENMRPLAINPQRTEQRRLTVSMLVTLMVLGHSLNVTAGAIDAPSVNLSRNDLDAYTAYVDDALERWHIPGAAIVIVQNGETVLVEGFGVTEAGTGRAVTADTQFVLGSASKPISDTLVATLLDDAGLSWDTRAVDLYADFQLGTGETSERITIRDLLSMRAGISNADGLWENQRLSPSQLIDALAEVDLARDPGDQFEYDNLGMAAGVYLGVLSAAPQTRDLFASYANLMQENLLGPMGMTRTSVDPFTIMRDHSESWGHTFDQELRAHTPYEQLLEGNGPGDGIIPAGGIASTARDMGRFLAMQLNDGIIPDGTRLVARDMLLAMRDAHSVPEDSFEAKVFIPSSFTIETDAEVGYGLGWFAGTYQGVRTLLHPGNQQGFTSVVAMLPESNTGIAILTNADFLPCGYGFLMTLQNRLTEIVHGLETHVDNVVEHVYDLAGLECGSLSEGDDTATASMPATTTTTTPVITDAAGLVVPGSIASEESVLLGGIEQTIVMRGRNETNPLLLVLHGGPGFAMTPWLEYFQKPLLEEHFVVVHWDQRGSGKSFTTNLTANDMSVDQLVDDTLELSEYLLHRFDQDKLFLTGHSWGSALGFMALMKNPEPFHAYIASAEAAHWNRRQQLSYDWALEQARNAGDNLIRDELESLEPFDPTNSEHVDIKNSHLDRYRGGDIYTEGLWDIYLDYVMSGQSPLYPPDQIENYMQGLEFSAQTLDDEIANLDYDLFEQYSTSPIPIHFLAGRHDQVTPGSLAHTYYRALKAPEKSFTWFERSGHTLMFDEPDKWARTLVDIKRKTLGE